MKNILELYRYSKYAKSSGEYVVHWTFLFPVGCLVVIVAVYRAFLLFREEIERLPDEHQANQFAHVMLGASLEVAIDLPECVKGRVAIVQFAAPSCVQCHEELRALEKAYKEEPFPYVCLYEDDPDQDDPLVRKFAVDFGHLNVKPLERELMYKLGVQMTPIVMLIDENAIVRQVEFQLPKLLASMRAGERRAG